MKGSVVAHLIWKDWQLQRLAILVTVAGGVAALAVAAWGSQNALVVGGVLFFMPLILVGHMLPLAGMVNERKKQNLAFLMSLPISSIQYTTSKLVSSLAMFLISWVTLVLAGVVLIEVHPVLPAGVIPLLLILALLPFLGFCLVTGTVLISESEGWGIAANVFCSSTYGLTWYFLTQVPGLMKAAQGPTPVWTATEVEIVTGEIIAGVLMLGITYFFQSRKRDFV